MEGRKEWRGGKSGGKKGGEERRGEERRGKERHSVRSSENMAFLRRNARCRSLLVTTRGEHVPSFPTVMFVSSPSVK